jgi:hypothetical protein
VAVGEHSLLGAVVAELGEILRRETHADVGGAGHVQQRFVVEPVG